MLKIRLQRVGRKHEPSFRLVLTDSKNSTKSGRFAEVLGNYDPRKSTEALKTERIKHWLTLGAAPTGSVNNLLIKKGLIRGEKIHVGKDFVVKEAPKVEEVASASAETPVESRPVEASVTESAPAVTPVESAPESAEETSEASSAA